MKIEPPVSQSTISCLVDAFLFSCLRVLSMLVFVGDNPLSSVLRVAC